MLISNIWGIWPEERPPDDKASPVSLGPSYAVCTPATGRTAAPFPQQHLHQSFSLPTLTALLIAPALWKQPSGGTSGTVWRCDQCFPKDSGCWTHFHYLLTNFPPSLEKCLSEDIFYQGIHSAAVKLWQFSMKFTCWPLLRPSSVSS